MPNLYKENFQAMDPNLIANKVVMLQKRGTTSAQYESILTVPKFPEATEIIHPKTRKETIHVTSNHLIKYRQHRFHAPLFEPGYAHDTGTRVLLWWFGGA